MGKVMGEVTFRSAPPTPAAVAERATEIVGLTIVAKELGRVDAYVHADFRFEAFPKVSIYVEGDYGKPFLIPRSRAAIDDTPAGVNGSIELGADPFVYHIESYTGVEPTLQYAIELALEALGGISSGPLADNTRREYGRLITAKELTRRRRKVTRKNQLIFIWLLAISPILLVLSIIYIPLEIVRTSYRVRKFKAGLNPNAGKN